MDKRYLKRDEGGKSYKRDMCGEVWDLAGSEKCVNPQKTLKVTALTLRAKDDPAIRLEAQ